MRFAVRFAAVLLVAAFGCSGESPPPSASNSTSKPDAPAEVTWDAQVAAVRLGTSDEIRVEESPVTSTRFRELSHGCERLRTLVIERADLADSDLAALVGTPHLRWLKLPGSIGDDGAAAVAALKELEILNLPDARLTDAGLRRLASLDRLTLLRLGSPDVTDAGLASLRDLPRLKFLHLMGVPLTDAGVDHVAAIGTLESFYLDGGNATDAGLSRLLVKRPELHFHKDQRHLPGDPNTHAH